MSHITHRVRRTALLVPAMALALTLPAGLPALGAGPAEAGCPTWTADGSTLVFCSGSDGIVELWEVAPDRYPRQLTFLGGRVASPDVSPDGSLVVFEASVGDDTSPQIYVIPREGQRGRTVLVGSAAVDVPGVRAVRLTSEGANYDPAFSPGGDRIDFTSDRQGLSSLWSMGLDGAAQQEVLIATISD